MTHPSQPPAPAEQDEQPDDLDEALEESFPASDPVAVDITAIDTDGKETRKPERS
jgi:hypothetical protein